MNATYPITARMIEARISLYEHMLALLRNAQKGITLEDARALSTDHSRAVFQIHLQQDAPGRESILIEGEDLCQVLLRFKSTRHSRPPELFLRFIGLRVAIAPEDAQELARKAGIPDMEFTVDSRIKNGPGPMAFGPDDKLPSAWYADSPEEKAPVGAVS